MSKRSVLINEDIVSRAEKALKQLGQTGLVANRLKAIIASHKHGIKTVATVSDVSRASIHRWVNVLREKGVEGLKNANKPSRSKLKANQKKIIKHWLEANPNLTIKELGIRINKEFKTDVGKSSIHRSLISLGFSHITGRQKHYKGDQLRQEDFKKNYKN